MTTLADIETAANALSASEKQQLMLFLASRLQEQGSPLPNLPGFSGEAGTDWMAEDEAAMRRVHLNERG